uniref:Methyl-accepting transducer domain-containing protein n=1 Tax=Leptospira ellisii TaxID=2023197 RepID=A0A2N0BCJ6_9LEPT|nr:hypothetical protein CH379_03550 [Leptospira ellisii]
MRSLAKNPKVLLTCVALLYLCLFGFTFLRLKNGYQSARDLYSHRIEQLKKAKYVYEEILPGRVASRRTYGVSESGASFLRNENESLHKTLESMSNDWTRQHEFNLKLFEIFGEISLVFLFVLSVFSHVQSERFTRRISILNRKIGNESFQFRAVTEDEFRDIPALRSLAETLGKYGSDQKEKTDRIREDFNEIAEIVDTIREVSHRLNSNISDEHGRLREIHSLANSIRSEISSIDRNSDAYYVLVSSMNVEIRQLDEMMDRIGEAVATSLNRLNSMHGRIETGFQTIQMLAESVTKIETNSREMKLITALIKQISERVNLLALNAAIESARAGAYGRGFSVVAREIGILAAETDKSAKTIESLIQKSIQESNNGHSLVERSMELYDFILNDLESLKVSGDEIGSLVDLQTQKRERIKYSSDQIDKKSDEIYNSIKQHKSANSGMETQISEISSITSESLMIAKSLIDSSDLLNLKSVQIRNSDKNI